MSKSFQRKKTHKKQEYGREVIKIYQKMERKSYLNRENVL